MPQNDKIADGLYRLIKWQEDHNPVFPSSDTVVEVNGPDVINVSTQRRCELDALGPDRSLFGPLENAYDITPVDQLPEIPLGESRKSEEQLIDPAG